MQPLKVREKDGYRILEYRHDIWEATGIGTSGSICFCPGRETPCEFLVQSNDRGYVNGNLGKVEWRDNKGVIHRCECSPCCKGLVKKAIARSSITAIFSAINSGSKRSSSTFSAKNKNGEISLYVLYLALLTSPRKPEYIREELISALNSHPDSKIDFIDDWREQALWYGSAFDRFEEFAKIWIVNWLKRGGSKALKDAAKLLEKIEKKTRRLEKTETDFEKAVGEAATVIFDVPPQKAVWNLWKGGQAGRTEKNFRDVRDRLGFSWLPAGKRGKNAH